MINNSIPTIVSLEQMQSNLVKDQKQINPFLPITDYISFSFPNKKVKKEEQIIGDNQELFNVNLSKSIYLSKINQLVDAEVQRKEKNKMDKLKRKVSEYDEHTNVHQYKLARNRQSARDSRKRKKIYIQLLENKVEELQLQIQDLKNTVQSQSNYINYYAKIPSMIYDFHHCYQQQLNSIQHNPSQRQFQILDHNFGVKSISRVQLCNSFFNTLMEHIIPYDLRKMMEAAFKNDGVFLDKRIEEHQKKLKEESTKLEYFMYEMAKNLEQVRKQCCESEEIKDQILNIIGLKTFANFLHGDNMKIKEESEDSIQLNSF